MGVDSFQADRSPTRMYFVPPRSRDCGRTRRAVSSTTGAFATLRDVIEHYDVNFQTRLNGQEKTDLVEYLKSL